MGDGTVVRLRWLGQAGFLVEAGKTRLLVDPWFSDHELRLANPPRLEDLPEDVAWLLATHEHADHLDLDALPALVSRFTGLRVVVPSPLVDRVAATAAAARVEGVQPGDEVSGNGVRIAAVPAWHGVTIDDGYSGGPPGHPTPHVGYVIHLAGVGIYHSGDTIVSPSLIEAVAGHRVDVALLPINGRDYFRESDGVLGNLDAAEAAQLAAAIGARVLIPMHYDMVRGNVVAAGTLVDAVASGDLPLHVVVPTRHHPIEIGVGST